MNDPLLALVIALIAWLLGLLTPQIVERIARRYRRPELMKSIALELDELRFKLVTVRCSYRLSKGALDRAFVTWAATRMNEYKGVLMELPARQTIMDYANSTNEELATFNTLSRHPADVAMSPKKIALPFITSQLASIGMLPTDIQRHLIEVLTRIEHYNTAAEDVRGYHTLTFDAGLTDENRAILLRNLERSLITLDHVSLQIVEQADSLIPRMER